MREALLQACRFNWSRISPAIFGSMFQLVKSKEARRADGEHYTSEKNILKVIEPLFLNELREKADRLIAAKSTTQKALQEFRDSLADYVFCDPACGCGNFLVVAYRELRKIETDLIVELRKRQTRLNKQTGVLDISFEQRLSIGQFYGFEINWWPARIAETAMFLVDHQMNKELAARIGQRLVRLPINVTAHIAHANALELDWEEVVPEARRATYVFGNPPFIGQYTKTEDQRADMRRAWGKEYDGYLDYVTAWHAMTMKLLAERDGEFAFVTTNSITQGQPVPALFGPLYKRGWDIKFAHRTFAWDSEAPGKAAVHCVIVGFTRDKNVKQLLWDYETVDSDPVSVSVKTYINAYLADAPRALVEKRSRPLSTELTSAAYGSKPADGGNLIVAVADYEEFVADPIAAKYLRPFRGSRELVHNLPRWCLWMAGKDFDSRDLDKSALLRERVELVKAFRNASKKAVTRENASTPYLFQEIRSVNSDYVAIPRHLSANRSFMLSAFYEPEIIVSDANFMLPDPDGLQFGLISSSMFITWQKTIGGRIKSDIRFSNTLTWNTFPVPELNDSQREAIIAGGKGVLEARAAHPGKSLADLYNPLAMPLDLVKAHKKLDRAVDAAFGLKGVRSNDQRLTALFDAYEKLAGE